MKTDVVQKVVVLNAKGELLMVRRSKTDVRRPLQWDLPGGMRDGNEELIPGAARELLEETGLNLDKLTPVFAKSEIRTWKNDDIEEKRNVVFIFYAAVVDAANVSLSYEHDTYQWKPLREAMVEFEYPLHKEVLNYLAKNNILNSH